MATTTTIKAATNPGLANDLIKKATAEKQQTVQPAEITSPSETLVVLPAGYVTDSGEVLNTAEVRELTGRDEEAIAKNPATGKALATILSRAVVSVGNLKATDDILDHLLAGDRDALLLGIYKATFGSTAKILSYCMGCKDDKTVEVNIDQDITTKALVNPLTDRHFTVSGKHEYEVSLPDGRVQREITTNTDKTVAELTTLLLERTITAIDGSPVYSKTQVQNIGIMDRRLLGEELANRAVGPQLEDLIVSCPDCDGKVEVPINFGTLFRF